MKHLLLPLIFFASLAYADSKTDTTIVPKKTGGSVLIQTNKTTRMSINNAGTIDPVGGFGTTTNGAASASASGLVTTGAQTIAGAKTFNDSPKLAATKGIDFSANTPASGVTSQVLSWYEEGTFTPALTRQVTTGLNVTYTVQVGRYYRIGNRVTIQISLGINTISLGTSSGLWYISGLPFATANTVGVYPPLTIVLVSAPFSSVPFVHITPGSTYINLYRMVSNSYAVLDDPVNGGQYIISGTYSLI